MQSFTLGNSYCKICILLFSILLQVLAQLLFSQWNLLWLPCSRIPLATPPQHSWTSFLVIFFHSIHYFPTYHIFYLLFLSSIHSLTHENVSSIRTKFFVSLFTDLLQVLKEYFKHNSTNIKWTNKGKVFGTVTGWHNDVTTQ